MLIGLDGLTTEGIRFDLINENVPCPTVLSGGLEVVDTSRPVFDSLHDDDVMRPWHFSHQIQGVG